MVENGPRCACTFSKMAWTKLAREAAAFNDILRKTRDAMLWLVSFEAATSCGLGKRKT
jgi:hypothetical protein